MLLNLKKIIFHQKTKGINSTVISRSFKRPSHKSAILHEKKEKIIVFLQKSVNYVGSRVLLSDGPFEIEV